MGTIFNSIKRNFLNGSMLMKLIFINIGIFVILRLLGVVFMFTGDGLDLLSWIGVPANIFTFAFRPWTAITYMFVQYDILHILFNMLWLYWFGIMFLNLFTQKQLLALYIYGGLGGAIFFLLLYNLLPISIIGGGLLIGASASVIAIVVATAMRAPNYPVNLLFFGAIKLKWIAIVTIFIDVISVTSTNAGGHLSHLGGALIGFLFAYYFAKGKDITLPFNKAMDKIVALFSKRGIYVGKKPKKQKAKPQDSPKSNVAEMDAILDKIKKSGYKALTEEEKNKLFDISRKV